MYDDKILKQFSLLGKFSYLFFVLSMLYATDFYFALATSYGFILTLEYLILITGISGFFEVIFLILILIQIKKIDSVLKEKNFHEFFSYTLLSFIIVTASVIGNVFVLIFGGRSALPNQLTFMFGGRYLIIFFCLLNRSWKSLEKFFYSNSKSFPNNVADNAVRAIETFHFGVPLYLFVIPGVVGAFYYLKGSILLDKALKSKAQFIKKYDNNIERTQNGFEYSFEARGTETIDKKK